MSQTNSNTVTVRYMIDDVDAAVAFYTTHLGFHLELNASPAFASVVVSTSSISLIGRSMRTEAP